jgi:hypothetical protein
VDAPHVGPLDKAVRMSNFTEPCISMSTTCRSGSAPPSCLRYDYSTGPSPGLGRIAFATENVS